MTQLRNHTCPTHLILEATHPTAGEGKHRGRRHTVTGLHSCPPALLTDKHRDKTHNHGEETHRALETVTRPDSHLIFRLHTSEISSKVAVAMYILTLRRQSVPALQRPPPKKLETLRSAQETGKQCIYRGSSNTARFPATMNGLVTIHSQLR